MLQRVRWGFWLDLTLATISATLFVVTLAWHDWIEIVFRIDPDHGNGWLEWLIVAVAFGFAVGFSIRVRLEWRRAWRRAVHDEVTSEAAL
jgi:hypothetical protein